MKKLGVLISAVIAAASKQEEKRRPGRKSCFVR